MSRSIHTTYKDLKGLTKEEINEQVNDPDSDLTSLAKKSSLKKAVIKKRKNSEVQNHMENNDNVKILFRFHSNVLDEETVETMWATVVDINKGLYKLDSIPFYITSVASNDIVLAEFDEHEQMLTFRENIEYSGNSIIQVILMDKSKGINQIRDLFKNLGCESEKANDAYFSMEIPANIDYQIIKKKLEELRTQEILDYAEPCLAEGHRK